MSPHRDKWWHLIYEYGYKYLRLKHFDHFKMWCELRSLSIDSEAAWATYFTKVLTYEEKAGYAIAKQTYKLNNLAAVLRMFGGCFPLGCSFDTETEYLYLKTKLEAQEEALQKIHDNVEKMIKEEKPQETATNGK